MNSTHPAVDVAAIAARHPAAFLPVWRSHGPAAAMALLVLAIMVGGFAAIGVPWPRFLAGLVKLGEFLVFMLPPSTDSWAKFLVYLHALAETVAIAFLGTMIAAALALPLGLLAAKNIVPQAVVHFAARRLLDTVRGVDELIWALIWINVVGLGPFAGILAVASANTGAFAKLFSEAIEAADRKPVDGVVSTGGSAAEVVRYGLFPQVVPVILSQVLYYFESNTRSATIIGIVGAGGIGLHLAEQIRVLEYQHVSALILMILVAVTAIDMLSTRLRGVLITGSSARS